MTRLRESAIKGGQDMSDGSRPNEAQEAFWTAAGQTWVDQRERFEQQAGAHGLAAMDTLGLVAGETVLDVGCGAGTSVLQLAERVGASGSAIGIDISPSMIAGAQSHAVSHGCENATFLVADAMTDDLPPADAAFSRFGVMFFADATTGFANIRRALRDGGRMGFVCWQTPQQNPWASQSLQLATKYVDMPFGGDPTAPSPFSLADKSRIETVMSDAGFSGIEIASREASLILGESADHAVDFLTGLMPPIDGDAAKAYREDLRNLMATWQTDKGIESPSATWIVSARQG